jgi:hypothetical protein
VFVILLVAIVLVALVVGLVLMQRLRLRPLTAEAKARYAESWQAIQTRFIEEPAAAIAEADQLAVSILRDRGARMDDEKRVPAALRQAREAARTDEGESGTEGMRKAMLQYQRVVTDAVGEIVRKSPETTETGRPEAAS